MDHASFGILVDNPLTVSRGNVAQGKQVESFAIFGNRALIILLSHQAVSVRFRCQRIGNTHLTFDHFLPNDGRLGTTSITGPDNGSGEGGGTRDADDQGLTLQR